MEPVKAFSLGQIVKLDSKGALVMAKVTTIITYESIDSTKVIYELAYNGNEYVCNQTDLVRMNS